MATLGHFNVHRAMVTRFIAIKPILWYVLFVGLTVGNIRNVSKVSGRPGEVQKFHKRAVAVITGDFTQTDCASRAKQTQRNSMKPPWLARSINSCASPSSAAIEQDKTRRSTVHGSISSETIICKNILYALHWDHVRSFLSRLRSLYDRHVANKVMFWRSNSAWDKFHWTKSGDSLQLPRGNFWSAGMSSMRRSHWV